MQAAKNMIQRLREDNKVGVFVQEMETLCDAYIQLANFNVQQYKTETSKSIFIKSYLGFIVRYRAG